MQQERRLFVPRHVRLLVFDLEHVVFDSASLKLGALRRSLLTLADDVPHDVRLPDEVDVEDAYTAGGRHWFEQLDCGQLCEQRPTLAAELNRQMMLLAASGAGGLYPGVRQLLEVCHGSGLNLALGAECSRDFLLAVSDRHDLDSQFDLVACTEEYGSGGLGELLEDVSERLEAHSSECVYLGTRALSLEAAALEGIAGVVCGWGVRAPMAAECADITAATPAAVIDTLRTIDERLFRGVD